MRELCPASEEDSRPQPYLRVCLDQSLALLGFGGWVALAGDTDDSWMKSQLLADASEQGLHLQNAMCYHVREVGSLIR